MEERKFLRLNDIEAYRISFALSNRVWLAVGSWNSFARDTIGQQFVRSVDSISANIAEGFGRYGKRDKIKFFRYAQGSMYESLDWNEKAKVRQLLDIEQYESFFVELKRLPKALNGLIRYTDDMLKI
ncbi:four helix bundle protein [Hymenobacter edaphi]|uniref:Four helix bundle protein n=2 Tax=Hymenobacter edaphi TaxID=2211146 RepID=A0A328BGA9_9BACT|nr:four helix bundle protein [Hymenobacter edaphi]